VTVLAGKKSIKKTKAALKLVKGKCAATVALKLKKKAVAGKKLTVVVKFDGNGVIGTFSSTATVKVKKK
jgi:3-hydroxymyristoyl/3-hydroxydecanoyl-(acyl carrier protein) dehydratase